MNRPLPVLTFPYLFRCHQATRPPDSADLLELRLATRADGATRDFLASTGNTGEGEPVRVLAVRDQTLLSFASTPPASFCAHLCAVSSVIRVCEEKCQQTRCRLCGSTPVPGNWTKSKGRLVHLIQEIEFGYIILSAQVRDLSERGA